MNRRSETSYLESFLKVAPLSHALWRSVEALSFGDVKFVPPVLDLGCGFGEFAGVVFDKVEVGIDVSARDLEKALKGHAYGKVQWADARSLPYTNGSFKTVTSVSVLEHIKDAHEVLPEVARVLKRGGLFVFSVPTTELRKKLLVPKICNRVGLPGLGNRYYDLHCKAFRHVHLRSRAWWIKKLEESGFEVVQNNGTLSPTTLILHEIFLITAFPSQLGKLLFGRRFVMSAGMRSKMLPPIFSRFVRTDEGSDINVFFVAKKR